MKYKFSIVTPPAIYSFTPLASQKEMIESIAKEGRVSIWVSEKTKTSLSVSVSGGRCSFVCGYIPKGCENLKFHESYRRDFWGDGGQYCHYFKVLKKQKWNEFKQYVIGVLESLNIPVQESLEVNVVLRNDIRERLEAPYYDVI